MNRTRVAQRSNWVVRRHPRLQRALSRLHARLYLRTGGRFMPRWFDGAPGDGAGDRRPPQRAQTRHAASYLRDGDAFVVLAANAGAARTPAWWLNLQAAGEGELNVGRHRLPIRPRVLEGSERDRLWRRYVQMYPQAELYTRFTDRAFPLVALEPVQ